MSFGKWLRVNRKAKGLTQDQLAVQVSARGINTTAGYISNLEREYYKTQFNKPSRPNERLVDTIAEVLGQPLDEARLAAGYAPTEPQTRIQKLIAALDAQGVDGLSMFGGFTQLADMTDEQYEEAY